MKRFISILTPVMLLSSCIGNGLEQNPLSVETDVNRIEVKAEFPGSRPDSIRRVVISSNRSWHAHLNDRNFPVDPSDTNQHVSWGKLSCSAYQNLVGDVEDVPVDITFCRNISDQPVAGSLDIYADGRIVKTVDIIQEGAVYHLDAKIRNDRHKVTSVADTISISIDCNTFWHVEVDESSTAKVSLSDSDGFDPGEMQVYFDDNMSKTEKKHARIVISAENCESKSFDFEQDESKTYLVLDSPDDVKHGYYDNEGLIKFRTDTKWQIEILENNFHDFALSATSGDGSEAPDFTVKYTFKTADDPAVLNSARLRLSAGKALEPVEINISQRGHLWVVFSGNKCFSPKLPTAESGLVAGYKGLLDYVEMETNRVNFAFTTSEGNEYMFSTDFRLNAKDIYNDTAKAWVLFYLGNNNPIGTGVCGIPPYTKLPGIEGMVMKKIIYHLTPKTGDNKYNKFVGWLYTDDYCYGPYSEIKDSSRDTKPTYAVEISATQLHRFSVTGYEEDQDVEFDLEALNILQPAGRGITVASNVGRKAGNAPAGVPYPVPDNAVTTIMHALVLSMEIFYEPVE